MAKVSKNSDAVSLGVERELLAKRGTLVAGVDEVGRGSVFGPVAVGVVVTDGVLEAPDGVHDSKQLSALQRNALVEGITAWASAWAVGYASAGEIDQFGITGGLRLAGWRALADLRCSVDWVLLDGKYDWFSDRGATLWTEEGWPEVSIPEVVTKVGADRTCASVAAASVLAKVDRDTKIVEMARAYPGYGLEQHKGYATPAHLAALEKLGASSAHRRSWSLPEKKT